MVSRTMILIGQSLKTRNNKMAFRKEKALQPWVLFQITENLIFVGAELDAHLNHHPRISNLLGFDC